MKYGAVLVALLILLLANAHGQWRQEGKAVPDTAWSMSVGEFGAMLLITDDPEGFAEQWNRPAAPGYLPKLTTASSAQRGDTVVALVIFSGCAANAEGNCVSEVDFKVLYPDGSVYADHKNGELWNSEQPPPQTLHRGVSNLGMRIEADDPFGTYRIEAVVRDKVAGFERTLIQELEVVPAATDGASP